MLEWGIIDCEEDDELESSCICGKENLRYLFVIKNDITGKVLYPIGSSCIKKFNRKDLNEQASINEQLFKLLHAVESGEYISLSTEFFSRKLLAYLYEDGAFTDNEYNNYDAKEDYCFMLDMFNKRNKDQITPRQHKKIRAIIVASIRPYLKEKLDEKMIHCR
ncbi:MAG: hypothetical protein IKK99_06075 [Oscillospiraceae bacterium]|nr:hypothetical protein [Oscillospiraceae bacterium]